MPEADAIQPSGKDGTGEMIAACKAQDETSPGGDGVGEGSPRDEGFKAVSGGGGRSKEAGS